MKEERTFLTQFFEELNKLRVRYAVTRHWAPLPDSLGGSDLDVLVGSEDDLKSLLDVVRRVSKNCGGCIVTYYRVEGMAICVAGRLDDGIWWGAHIDAFVGLRYHGFDYLNDKVVLDGIVFEKNLY